MGCGQSQQMGDFTVEFILNNLIKGYIKGQDMREDMFQLSPISRKNSEKLGQIFQVQFKKPNSNPISLLTKMKLMMGEKASQARKKVKIYQLTSQNTSSSNVGVSGNNNLTQSMNNNVSEEMGNLKLQKQSTRQSEQSDHNKRVQMIKDGSRLLDQRVKSINIEQIEMKDDGNCQFRAISYALYNTEDKHNLLRQISVFYLLKEKDTFQYWFEDGLKGLKEFCKEMSELGSWGNEITLKALVDYLGIKVHILQSTKENYYLVYEPENNRGVYNGHEIFITYISPIHYNSLIPNENLSLNQI